MRIVREGYVFAFPPAVAAIAAGVLLHPVAAIPFAAAAAFVLWFFRDPERRPPANPRALPSPADGKVIRCRDGEISVFMNVFDVHVCRAPMAGAIASARHSPGKFLAAWRDDAPERNERVRMEIVRDDLRLEVTLVAGLVARRIVLWTAPGDGVERGERLGLIRFGSRVDVRLPEGAVPAVRIGQRVRAGETVLAELPPDPRRDRDRGNPL